MGVTVKDFLESSFLKSAELLSGLKGLNRIITAITVVDTPDGINWLRGSELVMTTAYWAKDDSVKLEEFMDNLISKNVAALAIKLRFLGMLPKEIIDKANALDFPIFSLEEKYTWFDIINHFMSCKIKQNDFKMIEDNYIHFTKKVLEKNTISSIAQELYAKIGVPVFVVSPYIYEIIYAPKDLELPDELISLINKGYQTYESFKVKSFIDFPVLSYHFRQGDSECYWTGLEINVSGCILGNVWINGDIEKLSSNDILYIKYAVLCFAMELKRLKEINEVTLKFRNSFMNKILCFDFSSVKEFIISAREWGWKPLSEMIVTVLDLSETDKPLQILEILLRHQKINENHFYGIDNSGNTIIIFSGENINFDPLIREFYENFKRYYNASFSIGVSRKFNSVIQIKQNYHKAITALSIGNIVNGCNKIHKYTDIGMYRLIKNPINNDEINSFCEEYIRPIMMYDKNNNTELFNTLKIFLETRGNYKTTARKLYLHPNTIRYRIKTIEQICKIDLNSSDGYFNLQMAIKLLPLSTFNTIKPLSRN